MDYWRNSPAGSQVITLEHYCKQWDVTPLKVWPSFEDMLLEEITRVSALFGEETGHLHPELEFLPV